MATNSTVRLKGFQSGPTAAGKLRHGRPVGEWRFYFPKTQKIWQIGKYDEHGQKVGIWKIFDDNGVLGAEITYSHSKPTGIKWAPGAVDLGYAMTSDIFFVPGIEIEEADQTV